MRSVTIFLMFEIEKRKYNCHFKFLFLSLYLSVYCGSRLERSLLVTSLLLFSLSVAVQKIVISNNFWCWLVIYALIGK